jgi:phage terminase large subunit
MQHIFAQEVERNRSASVEGTIIPGEWVHAAIDAHARLHFEDDGLWGAGLDVADGGGDLNALAVRKGPILKTCDECGARGTLD